MKTIAFYLPQFHPIPENDKWWGDGFTEWHNVRKARALFRGHRQPQVPAELGYYDLRNDEIRHKQAELAKKFGISAFCYYHYWFNGKQLLETPIKRMLADRECAMPFCLCWANENWSRAWDGKDREILMAQTYSPEDNQRHSEHLCEIFKDNRYLKSDGKPIFIIYRIGKIPQVEEFIRILNETATKNGFDGVRIFAVRNPTCNVPDEKLAAWGIHDIVDFEPNTDDFPHRSTSGKLIRLFQRKWNSFAKIWHGPELYSILRVNYNSVVKNALKLYESLGAHHHPTVFPNWDNSPRRKAATIIQNDSPEDFAEWVRGATSIVKKRPEENQFLFVNAWNEWAESAHLEPEQPMGTAFLEAFKKGIEC